MTEAPDVYASSERDHEVWDAFPSLAKAKRWIRAGRDDLRWSFREDPDGGVWIGEPRWATSHGERDEVDE